LRCCCNLQPLPLVHLEHLCGAWRAGVHVGRGWGVPAPGPQQICNSMETGCRHQQQADRLPCAPDAPW
jgi:hypothetical protein